VQRGLLWLVSSYATQANVSTRAQRQAAHPRVCEQVKKLWKEGICHGDVAWRNVAISETGEVILLDLGLSQRMSNAARCKDQRDLDKLLKTA
jgi:tRNA A-37 threonylcarbamoyl transferase component Bud32